MNNLDFIFIFIYFAALLLIGYFSSRKQEEEDFLIGKRSLGTWSTMATINASKSGSIFMLFTALTYLWGFSAIWYFIGVTTGTILFIPFAMRLRTHSENKYYTLADYFKYNYGKKSAYIASLISIFLMFGITIMNLIAGAKIFSFFTNWSFWLCAVLMTFIILVYLLLGGFKAVAKTDILQYLAVMIILFMLTVIIFNGSLIPASDWNFFAADIKTVIGFFIVGISYPFAAPDLWQRVYSAGGKKQLRNGLLLAVMVYMFMAFLLALVAVTVKAQFPEIDPDVALIYGFAHLLPPGMLGLSVVLLFAAIMSTLDTYIFTGASAVVHDFFDWNKKVIVRNIRKVIFVFTILATIISVILGSLVASAYVFVAFTCTLAIPVMATWINRKIKERTIVISFIFGITGTISALILFLNSNPTIMILFAIAFTIFGLLIGGLVSLLKKS